MSPLDRADEWIAQVRLLVSPRRTPRTNTRLCQCARAVPVDLMPGQSDPASHTLPQQPFHPYMFERAHSTGAVRAVSNPYDLELAGRRILGHSGQPLHDMSQYMASTLALVENKEDIRASDAIVEPAAEGDDTPTAGGSGEGDKGAAPLAGTHIAEGLNRMNMLEACARWRHLAPTAPDTLACYPFESQDPFVIGDGAHVYFAGCQPSYQHRVLQTAAPPSDAMEEDAPAAAPAAALGDNTVVGLCVPSFATTQTAVLLDLVTLQATPLVFSVSPSIPM